MKLVLLPLLFVLSVLNIAAAQGIRFEKDSLPVVIGKASATGTPAMIFLDGPAHGKGTPQQQKRDLFNDTAVVKFYQQNFICYKADYGSSESQKIAKQYQITVYPAFIFLNSYGIQIYHNFGFANQPAAYISTARYVLAMIKSGNNIAVYQNRYNQGERSKTFLSAYITARERLGLYDNSDLVDEYVQQLTIKDINTYPQMLFILEAGPIVGSLAMKATYLFKPMRDSVYKTQPKAMDIAINNRSIKNSLDRAIATKNRGLAVETSTFTSGTYGANYLSGQRSSQLNMLQFYRGVNDTTMYLTQAGYFYDQYYMRISIDSARRFEQKRQDSIKAARERAAMSIELPQNRLVYTQTQSGNPFAAGLNTAAWNTYLTGTHNPDFLLKAVKWARRSIEIEPNPHNYDTLAHLLYQLNFYAEAEEQQNKAIELAKKNKMAATAIDLYKQQLVKIKQKSL